MFFILECETADSIKFLTEATLQGTYHATNITTNLKKM
jgi:hypothetical protein